jgi:hypothetical protein
VQAQAELVDQVESHQRPPEADAAPGHDVAVAASPQLVDLFCRGLGSSGDRARQGTCLRRAAAVAVSVACRLCFRRYCCPEVIGARSTAGQAQA